MEISQADMVVGDKVISRLRAVRTNTFSAKMRDKIPSSLTEFMQFGLVGNLVVAQIC